MDVTVIAVISCKKGRNELAWRKRGRSQPLARYEEGTCRRECEEGNSSSRRSIQSRKIKEIHGRIRPCFGRKGWLAHARCRRCSADFFQKQTNLGRAVSSRSTNGENPRNPALCLQLRVLSLQSVSDESRM